MKHMLSSALVAFALLTGGVQAATVSNDDSFFVAGAVPTENVRFRAQNTGNELFVGAGDLGQAANRAAAGVPYSASQAFGILYNKALGTLKATVGTATATANGTKGVTAGDVFNALRVEIRGPRTAVNGLNYFTLTGLTVNGQSIQDLVGATSLPNATVTFLISKLADIGGNVDFQGTLNYFGTSGDFAGAETARVGVFFGTAPIPVPAALPLMLLALGGLGLAARRRAA